MNPLKCSNTLCARHNTPSPNDVVSVASEQSLSICAPCQANTLRLSALLANLLELRLQLVNLALLLQIENDDTAGSGSAEPVSVGGEDEGVDLITGVQGVEVLRLVQIPEHGGSILSTRGAERSIRGDSDSVDVSGVSNVVGLQSARGELPNLILVSLIFNTEHKKRRSMRIRIRALVLLVSWPGLPGSEVANTL
jgi:hypothetical protein